MTNNHDLYFKRALTDIRVVKAFMLENLSAQWLRYLDVDTLQAEKDSFASELGFRYSDLIFSMRLNGFPDEMVYVVIEHKSYDDENTPFQLLKYQSQIWEQHRKLKRQPAYPAIIGLGFYHSPENFTGSMSVLSEVNDALGIMRETFNAGYPLVDMTQISNEAVLQQGWTSLMWYAQKNAHRDEGLAVVQEMMPLIVDAIDANARDYVEDVLEYLLTVAKIDDGEKLREQLCQALGRKIGESMMSAFLAKVREESRQEGIQEGIQQGRQQERLEVARDMLVSGDDVSHVSTVLKLSMDTIEAIQSKVVS